MFRILFGCFFLISVIIVVNGQRKPGNCPPPANVGVCALTCMQDNQCAGNAKCCRTACGGSICSRPVLPPPPKTDQGKNYYYSDFVLSVFYNKIVFFLDLMLYISRLHITKENGLNKLDNSM